MRKKLLVVVAAFALVLCMPAVAFAANSAFDKGTAESTSYVDTYTGNAFLMERDALNLTVERDLYWAGDTLNARGLEVGGGTGGSALLAGSYAGDVNVSASTINVSRGTTVGGTLRVPNNAQVAIEEGANVPNVSYVDDALVSAVSEGSEQRSFSVIGPLLFSCVAHALLVLLFFFLIKDAMESAVKLAETKLSRMFMLGFVAFFRTAPVGILPAVPACYGPHFCADFHLHCGAVDVFHPVCRLRIGAPPVRGHGAFGRGRDRNACPYRCLLYPVSVLRGANRMFHLRCRLPYAKFLGQASGEIGPGTRFPFSASGHF